jgi:hypothetical protein
MWLSLPPLDPKTVRDQFKAWCTRHLKKLQRRSLADPSQSVRVKWWTEGGSQRRLYGEENLEAAVRYVRDFQ